MLLRFIIGVVLIGFLTGCATTQSPTAVNNLQIKVTRVENRLDENEQEVSDLKYAVDELATSVAKLSASGSSVKQTPKAEVGSSSQPVESAIYEGILRVPVTSQEVQTALKNAGYYDGAIDGKLGSGSQKAIRDFQKDKGLQSDGIIGKKTWAELKNFLD